MLIVTNDRFKEDREGLWQQVHADVKGWGINQELIDYGTFEAYDDESDLILTIRLS